MKHLKIILSILISATLLISGCTRNEIPNEDYVVETSDVMLSINDTQPSSINDAQNIQLGLSLVLLKELSKENSNIFYSSFSINQALTMTYFGAAGETQEEISSVLGYEDLTMTDVAAYQKYLLDVYEDPGDTTFYSANSMWIDDQIVIKDDYINVMVNSFDSETKNIDLQSDDAVDNVNKWIKKKTEGMIPTLFTDEFHSLARLVLINAIYFKGDWTSPFNPEMTREKSFYGTNGEGLAEFMYTDDEVLGYECESYKSLSLPYGEDERFAFVAVLPEGNINQFIDTLDDKDLNNILNTFDSKDETSILLPKIEMDELINMNEILKALGMELAFTQSANFEEISATPLYISRVLHRAKIIVDETGTEAAAVTAVEAVEECEPEPSELFEFNANKPFVFFIIDREENIPLFTGVLYDVE